MAEANCKVKQCPKCGTVKPVGEFNRDRTTADGLCTGCKECKREQRARLMAARGDELRARELERWHASPERKARRKARVAENREYHNAYQRNYKAKDPEKWSAYRREYRAKNKAAVLAYQSEWTKARADTNPEFRLARRVRCRIAYAMNGRGFIKKSKTQDMIGCSWEVLRAHIARQFRDGMSFENFGEWHVDHIIPLASAKDETELIRLFHYTNLQPLWADENRKKGASIPEAA